MIFMWEAGIEPCPHPSTTHDTLHRVYSLPSQSWNENPAHGDSFSIA